MLVDWLPWNHTFGGNHNFNLILKRGGTMYIDAGRPAPPLIPITVRNLTEIAPTIYFNVPAGYGALLPFLERDAELRARFFERLDLIFYAAAALPQDLWTRLEAVAREARGEPVMMTSSWGLTETSPLATAAHFPIDRAGVIGVPVPGVEIKLTPVEGKLEMRVKGPNVTRRLPRPARARRRRPSTRTAGTGRATRASSRTRTTRTRASCSTGAWSRTSSCMTGTFVSVGNLRIAALAAASPLLMDAVVCGHDRDYVALLAWPNVGAAREIAGEPDASPEELVRSPKLAEFVRERFVAYNRSNPASSTRVERVILLAEPPSLDANEITDKGYVNQRAALERRAVHVAALFAENPGAGGDHLPVGMPPTWRRGRRRGRLPRRRARLRGRLDRRRRGGRALPGRGPRAPALRAGARRRLRGAGRDARHRGDGRARPQGRLRRDGHLQRHELPQGRARRVDHRARPGAPPRAHDVGVGGRPHATARTGWWRSAGSRSR